MGTLSNPAISQPKPQLVWYQQLWIGWPIILVFAGGLLGGVCGGAAWGINQKVFKSAENPAMKYLLTGLISFAAVIVYFVLVVAVLKVMH
jgi:hypothetical protein